ncbi:MAG TPA: Gfo/Idh/MocA family oxidoreductase [Coleofasciculaceae cyanobacterium]|jgi:predicted dehydrogenase
MSEEINISIVGCGFVADYYLTTLKNYPHLKIAGVYDLDRIRTENFARYHSVSTYDSFEELLEDPQVELVVNLTNPKSHFELNLACLEANKHVYSEKPLAMELKEAEKLVEVAKQKGLYLSSAPCSLLGETAQTIWKALREETVGKTYAVYAEMDDGLLHKMPYQSWFSQSGIPWPYKDEFEVGCTLEHAGYYLSWFPAFFGRAETVTGFSSTLIADKNTGVPLNLNAPDFSIACIKFASGVVVRLTCSIIAAHDHSLRIFGDKGILSTPDCWFYNSPVHVKRMFNIRRKMIISPIKQKYPLTGNKPKKYAYRGAFQMDFARGIAEVANAIKEKRPCRISAKYSLHVNELVLAIHNATETNSTYTVKSTFDPVEPMPWAK